MLYLLVFVLGWGVGYFGPDFLYEVRAWLDERRKG